MEFTWEDGLAVFFPPLLAKNIFEHIRKRGLPPLLAGFINGLAKAGLDIADLFKIDPNIFGHTLFAADFENVKSELLETLEYLSQNWGTTFKQLSALLNEKIRQFIALLSEADERELEYLQGYFAGKIIFDVAVDALAGPGASYADDATDS